MNFRITIDFGGGSLEYFSTDPFSKPQHIDSSMDRSFNGLDRVVLVMDGRSRAGQVVDFVHFNIEGKRYIMADQFKIWIIQQMFDIGLGPGKIIIHTND